jgi:broad specificity phosphatase PhoE
LSSKKIYIVRHGQTDYNLKHVVQGGGIDSCLNQNGINQAHAFYESNKHINFDKIYYTGLQRTKQSVEKFLHAGIPHEAVPDLNEISWGKYEGVPMDHSENEYYLNMISRWSQGDLDHCIEGGESPNIAAKRLRRGIEHVLKQEGQTILICMHGRAMRILLCILFNYDLKYMDLFEHQNLCCYQLTQLRHNNFRLDSFTTTPTVDSAGTLG